MTSSCIRLVWQPIQHKDRQRAESGETDSWVAANRQGGPTNAYGRYHHLRDVVGQPVKAHRTSDSCIVSVGATSREPEFDGLPNNTENSDTHGRSVWVHSSRGGSLDNSVRPTGTGGEVGAVGSWRGGQPRHRTLLLRPDLNWPNPVERVGRSRR